MLDGRLRSPWITAAAPRRLRRPPGWWLRPAARWWVRPATRRRLRRAGRLRRTRERRRRPRRGQPAGLGRAGGARPGVDLLLLHLLHGQGLGHHCRPELQPVGPRERVARVLRLVRRPARPGGSGGARRRPVPEGHPAGARAARGHRPVRAVAAVHHHRDLRDARRQERRGADRLQGRLRTRIRLLARPDPDPRRDRRRRRSLPPVQREAPRQRWVVVLGVRRAAGHAARLRTAPGSAPAG